ncbi:MAG: ABC transporter permease [Chlamydiae bacterium]|nr:ABC transporter permease [Chlamydiota bacterium]
MLAFFTNNFPFLIALGEYITLIGSVTWVTLRKPPGWDLIRDQLYAVGVLSLSVVALAGFSTGLVLAAQSFYQLQDKGLASVTGLMVAKAMLTELGPLITGFMVTGRVGAAMTAELGTMQVTEQVDALRSMCIDPYRYLVAPRFIAGTVMFPLLSVFCIVMGIFGGYVISVYFFQMAPTTYFDPIPTYVELFDFYIGFTKSFIFGVLISTICCYKGITTTGGAKGVGTSTTSAVVICYISILFSNFVLTLGLNMLRDQWNRWMS